MPWWLSSGQHACLLLQWSVFESRWSLQFFCKIVVKKGNKQKEPGVGPFKNNCCLVRVCKVDRLTKWSQCHVLLRLAVVWPHPIEYAWNTRNQWREIASPHSILTYRSRKRGTGKGEKYKDLLNCSFWCLIFMNERFRWPGIMLSKKCINWRVHLFVHCKLTAAGEKWRPWPYRIQLTGDCSGKKENIATSLLTELFEAHLSNHVIEDWISVSFLEIDYFNIFFKKDIRITKEVSDFSRKIIFQCSCCVTVCTTFTTGFSSA